MFEPLPTYPQFRNLTGRKFHKLHVLGYAGRRLKRQRPHWLCQCECGNTTIVAADNLLSGSIKACGCLNHSGNSTRRHNEACAGRKSTEYKIYIQAKIRCTNPNRPQWADYGGRGIEFRFKNFEEFLATVGRRPSPAYSLDRIDNNGHYEPGNVRWAERALQANNKRTTRYITLGDSTLSVTQWAKRQGIAPRLIHTRLHNRWCDECAVMQPLMGRCSHRSV